MSQLKDQYCVRLGPRPTQKRRDYVVWRMTRSELGRLLRDWKPSSWRKVSSGRAPTKGSFHPTARRRRSPANPVRTAVEGITSCRRGLYHGVGRDQPGLELLRSVCDEVVAYDPYHPTEAVTAPPRGTFDEVISAYTLNIVDAAEGKRALRQIHRALRKGGHATIAVRSDICRR